MKYSHCCRCHQLLFLIALMTLDEDWESDTSIKVHVNSDLIFLVPTGGPVIKQRSDLGAKNGNKSLRKEID